MHIGFRYHLASLMAVFFSLLLGILIGGILFQDGSLVEEQSRFIAELEVHFTQLEERLQQTRTELAKAKRYQAFVDEAWEPALQLLSINRLHGHTVLLSNTGEHDMDQLQQRLEAAGAEVIPAGRLAPSDTQGDSPAENEAGSQSSEPSVHVVWSNHPLDRFELEMLQPCIAQNRQLVLLYPAGTDVGSPLPEALVIDTADTAPGQLAAIQGIAQDLQGVFGLHSSAQDIMPPLDISAADMLSALTQGAVP